MPNDDTQKPPGADDAAPTSAPLRWLWKFNRGLDLVKGLSLVTVLSSLAVGYFQYLNAYQEKVGSQILKIADRKARSEEHTSELQSLRHLVCRLLLEKQKTLGYV